MICIHSFCPFLLKSINLLRASGAFADGEGWRIAKVRKELATGGLRPQPIGEGGSRDASLPGFMSVAAGGGVLLKHGLVGAVETGVQVD